MADNFIGEIRLFPFDYAPQGWVLCNGQILQIRENQALFALLGTMYGGDGKTTFALPDLRGRSPMQWSQNISIGMQTGEERHTLSAQEMPLHSHNAVGSSIAAQKTEASGNVWAVSDKKPYGNLPSAAVTGNALAASGLSQGHNNMQPYTALNFCIALTGIFPPRK